MLFHQIKLGYPSLWVKAIDSHRLIESIVNTSLRDYFTIDSEKGFSQYIDGQLKPILVDMPNPDDPQQTVKKVTYDFSVSYDFLLKYETERQKTFIFNLFINPDQFLQSFAGIFNTANSKYREAFWTNDTDQMPVQFIVTSPFDCPQDYSHLFKVIEFDYPTISELTTIVSHISSSTDHQLIKDSPQDIVKAGLGLSESDFINYSLQSVLELGEVSSQYIYNQKMSSIKKHGILEIMKPKITFDQIGGLDYIKDLIARNSVLWSDPSKAQKFGISPIRRMLMVGIPGTGKSAICEATASAMNLDLARTGVGQVMNSYIGQSEQNMRAVFKQINAMAPLCVWIDEFGRDLSGGSSSSHVDGGTTDRVHGEFLTGLQELPENVFLMCAANQLDHLKPEMLRADRFDKILFVGLPSLAERSDIFKIYLSNIDTSHRYNYEALANVSKYFTGAEIKTLIQEVKFFVSSSELRPITTDDIINYVPKMRNVLWNKSRTMIQDLYKTAIEQWDWASSDQFNDARDILNPTVSSAKVSIPKIPVPNR